MPPLVRRAAGWALLAAGCGLAAHAGVAPAQQAPQAKPVYDQYLPSRILKTGRQECMRNEDQIGAYCVRICQKGYVMVPNSNPPRCRSVEPLPPGSIAGPLRQETGTLPNPPTNVKPRAPSAGE